MRKNICILTLLFLSCFSSCGIETVEDRVNSFEPTFCGNHGHIPVWIDYDDPQKLLETICQFEREKKVKVTSFTPQLKHGNEIFVGIFVTFQEIKDTVLFPNSATIQK